MILSEWVMSMNERITKEYCIVLHKP